MSVLSVATVNGELCDQLHYSVDNIEQLRFKACYLKIPSIITEYFLSCTYGYTWSNIVFSLQIA